MDLDNETAPPAAEQSSEFMTNVYLYRGVNEFTLLPKMQQSKFESTAKTFSDSLFEHTFLEYPIQSILAVRVLLKSHVASQHVSCYINTYWTTMLSILVCFLQILS